MPATALASDAAASRIVVRPGESLSMVRNGRAAAAARDATTLRLHSRSRSRILRAAVISGVTRRRAATRALPDVRDARVEARDVDEHEAGLEVDQPSRLPLPQHAAPLQRSLVEGAPCPHGVLVLDDPVGRKVGPVGALTERQ